MNKMFRSVCLILLIIIIISSIPLVAYATEPDVCEKEPEEVTDSIIIKDACLYDSSGNQYGWTGWASLSAAQSYYGTGYQYSSCSKWFQGQFYNYFYTFTDGLKMYFGVNAK